MGRVMSLNFRKDTGVLRATRHDPELVTRSRLTGCLVEAVALVSMEAALQSVEKQVLLTLHTP